MRGQRSRVQGGADPADLQKVFGHLQDLEAIVVQKERHLVDVEGFLSLRGQGLEMGLRW